MGNRVWGIGNTSLCPITLALPTCEQQQRIAEILDTYDTRICTQEAYCEKIKLQNQMATLTTA